MINFEHSVKVKASAGKVWELILDLVRNPLEFMPLATSSEKLKWTTEGATSQLQVLGFTLKEKVDIDEARMKARFTLSDTADFSGVREIAVKKGLMVFLSVRFEWTPQSEKAKALNVDDVEDLVAAALKRWKAKLEEGEGS